MIEQLRLRARQLAGSHVLVGAITVVAVVMVVALIFGGLADRLFGPGGERVTARFSDVGALYEKSAEVRVRGMKVGDVKRVAVDRGGRSATVEMSLSNDALPLYRDAKATIRWRSLLGGTMVVELDRGTPAAGEMATPRHIPLARTSTQVELEQVISVLRDGARSGFKSMLSEMPRALGDPAHPGQALEALGDASPSLRKAARAVRGQQDGDLRRLVDTAAHTAKALDRPQAVRGFVEGTAATLETTANRAADLRRTIDLAGRIQPDVRTTLEAIDTTLGGADTLIAELRGPATQIAPAVSRLNPVLSRTASLLRTARPLLRSLRPASAGLADSARVGDPLLKELEPTLKHSDEDILRSANTLKDPFNGKTMRESLGPTMAVFDGLTAHFDHLAHVVRFAASGSERLVNPLPCGSVLTNPSTSQLVACKTLAEAVNDVFTWQPLGSTVRKTLASRARKGQP